jgi:glycosyltransferase involved in cell wall biosynthesis
MSMPAPPKRALFLQATDASGYPPTLHLQSLMLKRGWQLACLHSPRQDSGLKMPTHPHLQTISLPARSGFVMPKSLYLRYLWQSFRLLKSFAPDVVIYADPNATPAGLFPTSAIRVYQEHDTPMQLNPIVAKARRRLLSKADFILFPNANRADFVQRQTSFDARKLRIVWNLPLSAEVVRQAGKAGAALTLYYHGSINAERLPATIVEALKRFQGRVKLLIAGYEVGAEGYVAQLQSIAPNWVHYLGEFATRKELFEQMLRADVGLALMPMESDDINMKWMTGASNKAFDYMAGGLGLIVSELPDWVSMFATPGHALACNPMHIDSVQAMLQMLIDQPESLQRMRERNREKALSEWHFEEQALPFLLELEQRLTS